MIVLVISLGRRARLVSVRLRRKEGAMKGRTLTKWAPVLAVLAVVVTAGCTSYHRDFGKAWGNLIER